MLNAQMMSVMQQALHKIPCSFQLVNSRQGTVTKNERALLDGNKMTTTIKKKKELRRFIG